MPFKGYVAATSSQKVLDPLDKLYEWELIKKDLTSRSFRAELPSVLAEFGELELTRGSDGYALPTTRHFHGTSAILMLIQDS